MRRGGCVFVNNNQHDVAGVFMRNPSGLRGHTTTIRGIKGQATCGFKRPLKTVTQQNTLTHTFQRSIVCGEVVIKEEVTIVRLP